MRNKKCFIAILALVLTISFTGTAQAVNYSDAAARLKELGIMDIGGREDSIITKEEFVKAIVAASGLREEAHSLMGSTIYPDIQTGSLLSGYINAAVNNGLITGSMDGKFHPEAAMNFAQVCTILVKALGYDDSDLQGTWPKNYINKARAIGIAGGISLGDMQGVPLKDAAFMISRLLDTNMKNTGAAGTVQTYAESSGLMSESYQYAQIVNPVYSNPEVARDINRYTTTIGNIDLSGNPKIIKDGGLIDIADIEDNDVVYEVSDLWGDSRYILVVDNKVHGEITGISPSQIKIDDTNYTFGQGLDYSSIIASNGSYQIGDCVTALLGYDGRVVSFFDVGGEDNGNFGFVAGYTRDYQDYTVRLLMIDGNIREYKAVLDPGSYKGRLVKYTLLDDTIVLTKVSYNAGGTYTVDKNLRQIDDNYVSNNVKIFNLIDGDNSTDEDCNVQLMDWSDMPSGQVEANKILHMNTAGTFDDINVILVSDMLDEDYKTGIIKSVSPVVSNEFEGIDANGNPIYSQEITGYNYIISVDGTDKSWKGDSDDKYSKGNVLKVRMSNSSIESIEGRKTLVASGYEFEAVDINRVKIKDKAYFLKEDVQVYFLNSSGDYILKTLDDIDLDKNYGYISLYLDKSLDYGGKVDTIIIR